MIRRGGCSSIQRDLGAFVDDELGGAERLSIARHLQECGVCAAEAQALRGLGDLLRAGAPVEVHQDDLAGLASSVVSRFKAESQASWRAFLERACDGWHWAIVGAGSVAATLVSTSILSLILAFGPAAPREDSLSALMNNLGSPAGYFFVFVSPVGDDEDTSLMQVENGRPTASRMVTALAVSASHRQTTEADLVLELATMVTHEGRALTLSTMGPEARRRTVELLEELEQKRLRSMRRGDSKRSLNVREVRLVTSVTAKRL